MTTNRKSRPAGIALGFCLFLSLLAPAARGGSREELFVRGDVDGDGQTSIADGIGILHVLLQNGAAVECLDALDADDNGVLNIADSVHLISFLFKGGAAPPPPHAACGLDRTEDPLGCARHPACPPAADQVVPGSLRSHDGALDALSTEALSAEALAVEGATANEMEASPDRDSSRLSARESRALPRLRGGNGQGGQAGGTLISFGEIVQGEIQSYSDTDTYVFEATHGQWVVVDRMAATNAAGLNWKIEDPWGRLLASNLSSLDDLGPVALLGGLYTLTVLPEGSGTGTYQFRLIDASPVEREVLLQEDIQGSIDADHPGQRHHFHFSAPAGQVVFLDNRLTGSINLNWRLEDARGRILSAASRITDRGPFTLMGGDYRLTTECFLSGGNLTAGSYQFRIAGIPPPSTRAVAIGELVTGDTTLPGEHDVYTFTAAAGQIIFLDSISTTAGSNFNWELKDHLGRAVVARTGNFVDVGPIALAGGDYTLRILGEGDAVGSYSIRVADASKTQTSISIGAEVSGEIPADRPGRVNVYDFTVPPGPPGRIVTLELIQSSNAGNFNYLLEDALGRAVLPRTGSILTTAPLPLLGGSYRLSVLGEGGAAGTYRFRIRDDGAAGSVLTGTPVAVGDLIDGSIETPGGEARYTFTAAAGQSVYLDLLLADRNLNWSLFDEAGGVVGSKLANSTDLGDIGPHPLAAGTYTVVLTAPAATAAIPFRFQIADASPIARDAAMGDTISDTFAGVPGAVHRYKIAVSEGQRIFLDRLIVSTRLAWSLLDPAGQPIFALVRADGIDNDAGPFTLAAGIYTLVLDPDFGYQPAYQIGIRVAESSEETAPLGAIIAGNFIGKAGSTRTILLDVPDGTGLFFDRRSATARLDWSLVDPAGQPVFGPVRFDNGDGDAGPFTLAGGIYRLTLDPEVGYQPTYDVQIVAIDESTVPLPFGQAVQGVLVPGGTVTYAFDAFEGQRVFFDLSVGATTLRWSLLDEFGEAVFRDQSATSPTTDQGPRNLAAGRYRLVIDATLSNTPAYAFTASSLDVDLGIRDLVASPRVVSQGDAERKVEVVWSVLNRGGGPAPTGAWTDRLTFSADATLGNADDVVLGEFVRFDTLQPGSSYERRETVRLPAAAALGQRRIFLSVDSGGEHNEPGAEADNVSSIEVSVAADLPPAEPDFIATTSFPFNFTASTTGASVDVPLARAVSLDSIRFVHAEAVNLELSGPRGVGAGSDVTMFLLSGREEVVEISTSSPGTGGTISNFVVRFSRRLTPQVVALLSTRTIDGVRFRFDQPSTTKTVIKPIHQDGRLRVHFAGCEFAPCGPHIERRSPGLEGMTFAGAGVSEWRTVTFDETVSGDGLRFVSGPRFSASVSTSSLAVSSHSSETQLILDNGTLVTLDDSRSPSTLGVPGFLILSADHSLGLTGSPLAGRRILGFQWRLHATVAGIGGTTSVYTPADDFAVRFLYEVEACRGSIAIPPVELSPADGTAFAPGSVVTVSGRALAPQAGRPVSAVLVNGEPVDSLDAAGRFFKSVSIHDGENLVVVQVVEPGCGEYESLIRLLGLSDGAGGLEGFVEATAQLAVEYADTTFVRAAEALVVRARVRNRSSHSVRGPILMALTGMVPVSAALRGTAGVTGSGEPFTVLLESGTLGPGDAGPFVNLVFSNPDRLPLRYGVRWLVPADRPPHFESVPPVRGVVGQSYRYAPAASDPDGDAVTFEIERAPAGLALDVSGELNWTPTAANLGAHDVSLAAVAAGSRAVQRWTVTVGATSTNRPPYFSTIPVTGTAVGSNYVYDADGSDPDGDSLAYSLLAGPAGAAIDPPTGRVTWDFALPGEHAISIEALDGKGGEAVQSFLLAVGTIPSNPSAPRITNSPATEARAGILYVYQPVASDPDGDALQYSLEESPTGMTLDPVRGRIQWTPALDQVGPHSVSLVVRDGRGGETLQRFSVVVGLGDANLAPIIESSPGGFAVAGTVYRYSVGAIDPEGDNLRFALAAGPAGMTIEAGSGLLEWTPNAAAAAGNHVVSVEAIDPAGAVGRQAFELRVRASNAPPRITSTLASAEITAGKVFQVDVDAEDSDGDLLRYEIAAGPAGMAVYPVTGLLTWNTTPADVGQHAARVRVVDCCGGSAEASFALEVVPDTSPPSVGIGFSASPAAVGEIVEVSSSASDDVSIVTRTLTVECPPDAPRSLTLDEIGRTSFASTRPGYCTFRLTATDPSGNAATATQFLQVGNPDDPLDPYPPVVSVLTPAPGSVITALTNVVATVSDATEDGRPGSGVVSWTVEISPVRSGSPAGGGGGGESPSEFKEIGRGTGKATNALLATFDPTMLPNGLYKLRIVGNDGVQTGGIEYDVSVAGNLKLGNYTTEFVDLAIPLAGLPIIVARRYDSLDTSSGDFGAGWRLGLAGGLVDSVAESRTGIGLVDLLASEPFRAGTRVYVTRPDGQRVGFTFAPVVAGGAFAFVYAPRFDADPGVEDTLEVVDPPGNFFMLGGRANLVGIPYNPRTFRLTTKERISYTIDEEAGLERIEDPSGNAIDVRPNGLFSSRGPAVAFERDAAGRILRIVEPDPDPSDGQPPGRLEYAFDALGNLTSFTNQAGATVRYYYDEPSFPHYLTRVVDPLGSPVIRNAYDAAGRLIALCGSEGDVSTLVGCTTFESNARTRVSTVTDNRGFRTDLVFDDRGNLVVERRFVDATQYLETFREYDGDDRLTRHINPNGEAWTYAYDERGNEISRTDPAGRTWSKSYNACDLAETETDPSGNETRYTYDDACNLTSRTDPLGKSYSLVYDDEGRTTEMIDPLGNRWQYRYGANGFRSAVIDPRGKITNFEMNDLGDVVSTTDPDGRRIDHEYDAARRLIRETWNTVPPRVTTYEYDVLGRLIRAANPDAALSLAFLATGRIGEVDSSVPPASPPVALEYEYDGDDNIVAVTDSLGGKSEYQYDGAGRVTSLRQSGAGVRPKRLDVAYGSDSAVSELRRYADLAATLPVATTAFGGDCGSCPFALSEIVHRRSVDGSLIHRIAFDRDPAGLIVAATDLEGSHTYTYDGRQRLLAADHPAGGLQPDESYRYDDAGNRIESSIGGIYVYGYAAALDGNELVRDARFEYETDASGNTTRRRDRVTGASTEYRYDHRHRLTEGIIRDPSGTEVNRASYAYDPAGRRVLATEGGIVRRFVHDGHNPFMVLDGAGAVVSRRLYARSVDLIVADEIGGRTRWYLTDHLGTVRDLVGDDGLGLGHLVYDSFGRLLAGPASMATGEVTFVGREFSPTTGLYSMRAREYDPSTGRFLQRDPLDPYQQDYAGNNPLLLVDPFGRAPRAPGEWIVKRPFNPNDYVPNYHKDLKLESRPRWTGQSRPARVYRPSTFEYGLLASLIGVSLISAASWLGNQVELAVEQEAAMLRGSNQNIFDGL